MPCGPVPETLQNPRGRCSEAMHSTPVECQAVNRSDRVTLTMRLGNLAPKQMPLVIGGISRQNSESHRIDSGSRHFHPQTVALIASQFNNRSAENDPLPMKLILHSAEGLRQEFTS